MNTKTRAAICRTRQGPIAVEEIIVEPPRENEVMIRMSACGVCHSDLSAVDGTIPMPLPLVLGHEASGTVVQAGPGVEALKPGDPVLSCFVSRCGQCRYCRAGRPALCDQNARTFATLPDGTLRTKDIEGKPLHVFTGCGVMAGYATLNVGNTIKLDEDLPLESAALLGCAVLTGVGAVFNTARVEAGASVAVFGAGGVGLNVIQACGIADAASVVAVDVDARKLELALEFGATDTIDASVCDNVVKELKRLTGGGPDYCFECVGTGATVAQAYSALGKGGTTVVIGVARPSDRTEISTLSLPVQEKTLTGSWMGSSRPDDDVPRFSEWYRTGRLKLDELISRKYSLEDVNQAFEDLATGGNARGLIVFDT